MQFTTHGIPDEADRPNTSSSSTSSVIHSEPNVEARYRLSCGANTVQKDSFALRCEKADDTHSGWEECLHSSPSLVVPTTRTRTEGEEHHERARDSGTTGIHNATNNNNNSISNSTEATRHSDDSVERGLGVGDACTGISCIERSHSTSPIHSTRCDEVNNLSTSSVVASRAPLTPTGSFSPKCTSSPQSSSTEPTLKKEAEHAGTEGPNASTVPTPESSSQSSAAATTKVTMPIRFRLLLALSSAAMAMSSSTISFYAVNVLDLEPVQLTHYWMYMGWSALLCPIIGFLSDTIMIRGENRRPLVVLGALMSTTCFLLFSFVDITTHNYTLFVTISLLQTWAQNFVSVPINGMLVEMFLLPLGSATCDGAEEIADTTHANKRPERTASMGSGDRQTTSKSNSSSSNGLLNEIHDQESDTSFGNAKNRKKISVSVGACVRANKCHVELSGDTSQILESDRFEGSERGDKPFQTGDNTYLAISDQIGPTTAAGTTPRRLHSNEEDNVISCEQQQEEGVGHSSDSVACGGHAKASLSDGETNSLTSEEAERRRHERFTVLSIVQAHGQLYRSLGSLFGSIVYTVAVIWVDLSSMLWVSAIAYGLIVPSVMGLSASWCKAPIRNREKKETKEKRSDEEEDPSHATKDPDGTTNGEQRDETAEDGDEEETPLLARAPLERCMQCSRKFKGLWDRITLGWDWSNPSQGTIGLLFVLFFVFIYSGTLEGGSVYFAYVATQFEFPNWLNSLNMCLGMLGSVVGAYVYGAFIGWLHKREEAKRVAHAKTTAAAAQGVAIPVTDVAGASPAPRAKRVTTAFNIFAFGAVCGCLGYLTNVVLATGLVPEKIPIPPNVYVPVDNFITAIFSRFAFMPIMTVAAERCPQGYEAAVFELFAVASLLGGSMSGYLSGKTAAELGITSKDYSNLWVMLCVCAGCKLVPVIIAALLPVHEKSATAMLAAAIKEGAHAKKSKEFPPTDDGALQTEVSIIADIIHA